MYSVLPPPPSRGITHGLTSFQFMRNLILGETSRIRVRRVINANIIPRLISCELVSNEMLNRISDYYNALNLWRAAETRQLNRGDGGEVNLEREWRRPVCVCIRLQRRTFRANPWNFCARFEARQLKIASFSRKATFHARWTRLLFYATRRVRWSSRL